jgi:WD40 repeat protein
VEANQFFDPYLAEDIAFASGANDKAICLWTLDDDRKVRLVRKLVSHDLLIRSLRFIEKRTLVSCSHDGTIRLWDIKSGVCLKVIVAHVGQHVMDIYPITQRLLASCSGAGEVTVR